MNKNPNDINSQSKGPPTKRELNRVDAADKLIVLIRKASERPKRRVKTRPSRAKKEKRIEEKKVRGDTKKMRRKVREED